ncbi:hypothetical protein EVAR_64230_1 [Eumeta japonica]|uniref:Uncharacterized protein n=1 Tax=Eumeta variegata TaxID=151549 RepID=A0A4C1ZTA4_EUMVA|nr:hypothetical protein EVAR_64230_1 [Eumeta japonica]
MLIHREKNGQETQAYSAGDKLRRAPAETHPGYKLQLSRITQCTFVYNKQASAHGSTRVDVTSADREVKGDPCLGHVVMRLHQRNPYSYTDNTRITATFL